MSNAGDSWSEDDDSYEQIDPEEGWDSEFADDLVGSTLYLGLTFVDHNRVVMKREQVFGVVRSVSITAALKLLRTNGEFFTMAPVLDAIDPAELGLYQLSTNEELVENPDFVA